MHDNTSSLSARGSDAADAAGDDHAPDTSSIPEDSKPIIPVWCLVANMTATTTSWTRWRRNETWEQAFSSGS